MKPKIIKAYAWISFIIFISLWLAGILFIHLNISNFFIKFILGGLLFMLLFIIHGWLSSKIISPKK